MKSVSTDQFEEAAREVLGVLLGKTKAKEAKELDALIKRHRSAIEALTLDTLYGIVRGLIQLRVDPKGLELAKRFATAEEIHVSADGLIVTDGLLRRIKARADFIDDLRDTPSVEVRAAITAGLVALLSSLS